MSDTNQQFIDQLKAFNEQNFAKDIYIPSLERNIKFSTLTAKHQKDIIHSALDNPILNLIFHDKVYDIIKELCHEKEYLDTFTVYDKDAILIQMRYHFISNEYDEKDFTGAIDFIKRIKLDLSPKLDDVDGITIQYQTPSIKQERKILEEFAKTKEINVSANDVNEVRDVISYAYILEIVKHVARVQLNETGAVVDFNQHTFDENVEIVNLLGKKVCDKIHKFINDNRKNVSDMYKIDDDTQIEINSTLFS
jgi:hypothetical protein